MYRASHSLVPRRSVGPVTSVALAGLLALGSAAVHADEESQEEEVAGLGNTIGEVEFSALHFIEADPNDSAKFEEYRDVPDGVRIDHLFLDWWGEEGGWVDLELVDPVQDDQRLYLDFGTMDKWKGELSWVENPWRWSDDVRQFWTHQGDGVFTLPDAVEKAIEAAPPSVDADGDGEWDEGTKGDVLKESIFSTSHPVDSRYQRETGSARFEFYPTRGFTLGFSATHEERQGTIAQPLPMFFTQGVGEVALPIDWETNWLELFAEISRTNWNLGARLQASEFDDDLDGIVWDHHLFSADDGGNPDRARMDSVTDNEMLKWVLHGGFRLPARTRINWTISQGQTESDDVLLPKTINSDLAPLVSASPVDRFHGEYDHSLYDFLVTSHPADWLSVRGWWRRYEYENDSDRLRFEDYVLADHEVVDLARVNLRPGYEKTSWGLDLSFDPADWVDVGVGYENVDMKRHDAAVEDSDTDIFHVTADFDVTDRLFLRAKFAHSERDAEGYDADYLVGASFPEGEEFIAPFNIGMRRFYWTDRDRDELSLLAELMVSRNVSIFAEAIYAENDYFDPLTGQRVGTSFTTKEDRDGDGLLEEIDILLAGRIEDQDESYTLGVTFTSPKGRVNVWADYTWERWDWSMASRFRGLSGAAFTDDPADDWFSFMEDTYETTHVGIDARLDEGGLWHLLADLSWSRGQGEIESDFVPGGASGGNITNPPMPDTESELLVFVLSLTRKLSDSWLLGVRYWYESWDQDDWTFDFNEPYMGDPDEDPGAFGSGRSVFLGRDFFDYDVHALSFHATYKF